MTAVILEGMTTRRDAKQCSTLASQRAKTKLVSLYRDVYERLYLEELAPLREEAGLPPVREHISYRLVETQDDSVRIVRRVYD